MLNDIRYPKEESYTTSTPTASCEFIPALVTPVYDTSFDELDDPAEPLP